MIKTICPKCKHSDETLHKATHQSYTIFDIMELDELPRVICGNCGADLLIVREYKYVLIDTKCK